MPLNCCVPQCTNKGYRTSSGHTISYFGFPKCSDLSKKWILAICRDPGKDFRITELTKVCSRHFKQTNLKKSLNGKKVSLKEGIVPSKFPWTDSPHKRKAPAVCIPYYTLFSRHFNFAIFRKSRKFDVTKIKCRENLHARKLSDHTYKL